MLRNRPPLLAPRAALLAAILCASVIGRVTSAAPSADADAATIEACLGEPSMSGHDPRECGERLLRACLADAGSAKPAPAAALSCQKRRGDAWNVIARQAYHRIEAKLDDADKKLLRTSQVQFELELSDVCTATRALAGGDPDLAAAACASDVIAARALVLSRLAAGRGAAP